MSRLMLLDDTDAGVGRELGALKGYFALLRHGSGGPEPSREEWRCIAALGEYLTELLEAKMEAIEERHTRDRNAN